jgi:hypothetical protein
MKFLDIKPNKQLIPWRRVLEKLTAAHIVKKSSPSPHLLWNLKIHYHVHKGPLPFPL